MVEEWLTSAINGLDLATVEMTTNEIKTFSKTNQIKTIVGWRDNVDEKTQADIALFTTKLVQTINLIYTHGEVMGLKVNAIYKILALYNTPTWEEYTTGLLPALRSKKYRIFSCNKRSFTTRNRRIAYKRISPQNCVRYM